MNLPAINVKNLAKQYRIGERESYKTFREAIVKLCRAPFRRSNGGTLQSEISGPKSGTIWALKDVSFKVEQGEVIGIIGRNGAGKSTLLKILSKITEPTNGRIEIRGRVGSLLEVGTGFHPELTGHENIYLYGAILGMDRWEITRKFDEIIAFAELDRFVNTPVKRYSSGMYMRLAFAVAAHLEPEILLVDEVLAVGDVIFQKKCLGKMADVSKEGRTVLFVSHNMAAVRKLCQTAILLDGGEVAGYGPVSDCIEKYLAGKSDRSERILDHINQIADEIRIDSITVNGSPSDQLEIKDKTNCLKIEIAGRLSRPMKFDLEVRAYDLYDNPLGFFSPGHERGKLPEYENGFFHFSRSMELPRIMRGEYFLSFYLTTPNVRVWVGIPYGLRLLAEGTATRTGQVFDYYTQGTGWILIPEIFEGKNPV